MQDIIMNWLAGLTLFSLLSAMAVKLLPGKTYVPYVRLFSGIILILIFLDPLLSKTGIADKLEIGVFDELFSLETEEMESEILRMEESQKEAYWRSYANEVEDRIFEWASGKGYLVKKVECAMGEGKLKKIRMVFEDALTEKEKREIKNDIENFYQVKSGNIDIEVESENGKS